MLRSLRHCVEELEKLTTCVHKAKDTSALIASMVQKEAVLNNNALRTRQGHCQSEGQGHCQPGQGHCQSEGQGHCQSEGQGHCQRRSCSRGNVRETFERQGANHTKHVETTLYQTELKRKVHGRCSDWNPLLEDNVVRVICVTDSVGSSQQHLKGNVGNALPQMVQAFPWAFVQETQRHIKRSTCHE